MKKYSFVSITLILCLLISSLGTLPVFAAEETLLFELDMSGFDKSIEGTWGLGNKVTDGDEVTITARDGYYPNPDGSKMVTGVSSKQSFIDADGNSVDYILQLPQNNNNSNRKASTENTQIVIENKDWATKATTTEIWAYKEKKVIGNWLKVFRDAGDDRTEFDKLLNIGENSNSQNTFGLTGATSTKAWIYKKDDYKWFLFTIVATPVDTDDDTVADSMKYELQIDDKRNSVLVQTAAMSQDEVYGILIGNESNSNYYTPNQLGVASVKVYDGALTTEQVTAHYTAQRAAFDSVTMQNPVLSSITPEEGSTIKSHEGEFTLTFNSGSAVKSYIDEASLEEGIVLKDSFGTEIPSVKTLGTDKKTVTVKTEYIPEGTITLSVTNKLQSSNSKKYTTPVDKTYTVQALSYKSDFEDSTKWSHDTAHKYSAFNAIDSYIKGVPANSNNYYTNSTYTVNADGSVTLSGNGSSYTAMLRMTLGEKAVSSGTLVFDYDIKAPDVNSNGSACTVSFKTEDGTSKSAYLFMIKKNSTTQAMQLCTMNGIYQNANLSAAVSNGGYAADGWFRMRVVLSKNKEAGWTANVYNLDYSDTKSIITANIDQAASINYLATNTTWSMTNTWTVRNIAVKHTGSYIGGLVPQSLSGYERVNFTANVNTVNSQAVIIAALYYDNQLKAVQTFDWADITDGKVSGNFANLEGITSDPTVKVMMWDNLDNLNPLTESVSGIAPVN